LIEQLMRNYDPVQISDEHIAKISDSVKMAVEEDNLNAVKTIMTMSDARLADAVRNARVCNVAISRQDTLMLNLLLAFNCVPFDYTLAQRIMCRHSDAFDITWLLQKAPQQFIGWLVTGDLASQKLKTLANAFLQDFSMPEDRLICPITQLPIEVPGVTADGHVFETEAIKQWLTNHNTSPNTGAVLPTLEVYPCYALRNMLRE